jgi:hypothetical protein
MKSKKTETGEFFFSAVLDKYSISIKEISLFALWVNKFF